MLVKTTLIKRMSYQILSLTLRVCSFRKGKGMWIETSLSAYDSALSAALHSLSLSKDSP